MSYLGAAIGTIHTSVFELVSHTWIIPVYVIKPLSYFLKQRMSYLSVAIGTIRASVERRRVGEILFELLSNTWIIPG